MYSISVRFVLVDEYRYNFNTSLEVWEPVCEDRYQPGPSRCFEHSASPASGQNWNEKLVTFSELRLTNRATKSKSLVSIVYRFPNKFCVVIQQGSYFFGPGLLQQETETNFIYTG